MPSRWRVALSATGLAAAVVVLAGCSGPNTAAAPTGAGSDLEDAGPSAADTVEVPLTSETLGGSPRLTVEISVGGGAPFTVVLDTGSTGLFVDQAAAGSSVTQTGNSYTEDYVNSSITSTLVTADVSIGTASTAAPITLGLVDSSTTSGIFDGAQGIMGVAPADGDWQKSGLLSPFVQLSSPYNQGFTIDVPSTGAGTLTLGAPATASGTVSMPLAAYASPPSVASGAAFWQKDVNMCWTIASLAQACGPTDLDTGAPSALLNSAVVTSGVQTNAQNQLAAGQQITVSSPSGDTLQSYTTGSTPASDLVTLAALGSQTSYNTGLGFYFANVVGFDWSDGKLLVTAK